MIEIRPLNGYEIPVYYVCLTLIDTFNKFDFTQFRTDVVKEIIKYTPFHLTIKTKDGHFYWYKLNDKWLIDNVDIYITKVPFEETKKIETADYNLPQEGAPLFHVEYSENGATSRLKLYANHSLCDGRTIANLYQVLKNAIPNEFHKALQDDELLPFDYKSLYTINENVLHQNPVSWDIAHVSVVPPIAEKCDYINIFGTFDCQKVLSFCQRNKIGIQAILMASQERATRRFMNITNEVPISVYAPTDTSQTKFANEELKRHNFYCSAGANFPAIVGKESIMEDLKECNFKMKEALKTSDCCVQVLLSCKQVDEETLEFTPTKGAPSLSKMRVIAQILGITKT
ncbi:hypothetical protein EIN_270380 [Entamoeba invadens IP1]|uniref:Condensation domain-containing protein n=1 Tax=Entamoeba invadens IP1 TaxID=370355 RepID=A0A0A1UBS7_ENTIV|nr:hypothetical protein EIN_270380 [Entamoeba invadens IP1]ELP91142.1 hypothetical protein EIN_270380 [Entamoeba invadens IP1]|eukprot:XP_004257913.1 hypothetical protein EIN_270380 [Entamoeba invadens IP1]